MIVNPAPGALVRDPATKLVITDGAEVDPNEPYFARLLADGDLVSEDAAREARARAGNDAELAGRLGSLAVVATTPSEDEA